MSEQIHEVKDAISDIPNGTAAGADNVTKKTLQIAEPWYLVWLMNRFMELEREPESLENYKLHLIAKKQGAKEPSDHRPIKVGNQLTIFRNTHQKNVGPPQPRRRTARLPARVRRSLHQRRHTPPMLKKKPDEKNKYVVRLP